MRRLRRRPVLYDRGRDDYCHLSDLPPKHIFRRWVECLRGLSSGLTVSQRLARTEQLPVQRRVRNGVERRASVVHRLRDWKV